MELFSSAQVILKNPAWDVILILFFLGAGFVWGITGGKSKLLSSIFAIYLALFLSELVFRLLDVYNVFQNQYRNIIVYGVLLVIFFFVFEKTLFRSVGRSSSYQWWKSFIMSFSGVGLFVAGTLNIALSHGIVELSDVTLSLFAGTTAYLFWALVPFVGLFLVSRGR